MQDFIEPAWKFVNDSYLTDVHLMYKPHTIALAAIYMAAFTVKDSDINKWFADLNVNLNEVGQVCNEILSVYELWNSDFEKTCRDMLSQIQANLKKKK
jgi:cyclin-C